MIIIILLFVSLLVKFTNTNKQNSIYTKIKTHQQD